MKTMLDEITLNMLWWVTDSANTVLQLTRPACLLFVEKMLGQKTNVGWYDHNHAMMGKCSHNHHCQTGLQWAEAVCILYGNLRLATIRLGLAKP